MKKPAKTIVEQLRRGWCKNVLARSKSGKPVDLHSRHAVAWCLYGAAMKVHPDGDVRWAVVQAMDLFAADHEYGDLVYLNNSQTRLNKLILDCARAGDRAAKAARSKQ